MDYAIFVLASFANALITCLLLLFISKKAVKSRIKYLITFVLYVFMAYLFSTPDPTGILRNGLQGTNMLRFSMYVLSGACVCGLLFFQNWYYEKHASEKKTTKPKTK